MKKFIKKLLVLAGLCAAVYAAIFLLDNLVVGNQYTANFQASLPEKVARLESLESPKIILVGNSNLSYGIKSEMLEEALGMPVVNLGLHAGFEDRFHENIARMNIREGDIVVVCHTSYDDTDRYYYRLAWISIEKHYDLWKIVPEDDWFDMLCAYPQYAFDCFVRWLTGTGGKEEDKVYNHSVFNGYGDVCVRPEEYALASEDIFHKGIVTVPKIGSGCMERMNRFNSDVAGAGAHMVVAAYPIAAGEFTPDADEYREFQRQLEAQLDCDVISDFTEYMLPYEYFYNTKYHLTDEGAALRTELLISDLRAWIASQQTRPAGNAA